MEIVFKIFYYYLFARTSVYICICACGYGCPLELEIQTVISCLIWVLGIELGSPWKNTPCC